jgi:hypothetical protein
MTQEYWNVISEGLNLEPISERQLRDCLKKIRMNASHLPFPWKTSSVYFSSVS